MTNTSGTTKTENVTKPTPEKQTLEARINASKNGISNPDVILNILKSLSKVPAYKLANFTGEEEDTMVHLEWIREYVFEPRNPKHLDIDLKSISFRKFVGLLFPLINREIEDVMDDIVTCGESVDLDCLCRELKYHRKTCEPLKQYLMINLGALHETIYADFLQTDEEKQKFNEYSKLTTGKILDLLHSKVIPPSKDQLTTAEMKKAYRDLYTFVYLPLQAGFMRMQMDCQIQVNFEIS